MITTYMMKNDGSSRVKVQAKPTGSVILSGYRSPGFIGKCEGSILLSYQNPARIPGQRPKKGVKNTAGAEPGYLWGILALNRKIMRGNTY